MFTKIFIIAMLIAILIALGSSLFFLVKDNGNSKRTVKALSWRIGLSLFLFIILFIAYGFGFITPHSL